MVDRIRVGMGQMRVVYGDREGNLRRAAETAREAARLGCEILVLPECMDVGWGHEEAMTLAQPIPGAASEYIASLAAAYRMHIVCGLTEQCAERPRNSAVLFDDEGRLLLHTSKIHVLDVEQVYERGQNLSVAETRFGRVGVFICADAFLEGGILCGAMAAMGARIVLSPCSWVVPADYDAVQNPYGWETAYGPPAAKYDLPFVGVSHVGDVTSGDWAGRPAIGASLAMGRRGIVMCKAPFGRDAEGLFVADMGLREV